MGMWTKPRSGAELLAIYFFFTAFGTIGGLLLRMPAWGWAVFGAIVLSFTVRTVVASRGRRARERALLERLSK